MSITEIREPDFKHSYFAAKRITKNAPFPSPRRHLTLPSYSQRLDVDAFHASTLMKKVLDF
jgi:hypothetical protein